MDFTVYSDFTTPECYALNEQFVALGMSGTVKWRGVQHDPGLPVPMREPGRRAVRQLEDEIEETRRRAPGIEIKLPLGKPNTSRAIVAVASVARTHPGRAAELCTALFRAYWRDGVDLSVTAELQRIAEAAKVPGFVELDHPDAVALAESWEVDWSVARLGGVPRVIRGDGKILWGFRSRDETAAFFGVA
jgi:2-hydroxychromene-2-carboxylate isomerase